MAHSFPRALLLCTAHLLILPGQNLGISLIHLYLHPFVTSLWPDLSFLSQVTDVSPLLISLIFTTHCFHLSLETAHPSLIRGMSILPPHMCLEFWTVNQCLLPGIIPGTCYTLDTVLAFSCYYIQLVQTWWLKQYKFVIIIINKSSLTGGWNCTGPK